MISHVPTFCLVSYLQLVLLTMEAKTKNLDRFTEEIEKTFFANNFFLMEFLLSCTAKGILGEKIDAS